MAVEAPIPDVLTAAELDCLLAAVTGRSKTAVRDRALLMVAYDAALRSIEIVRLRPGDVDLESGSVNVRKGKGSKPRLIRNCLDPATRQTLSAWLALRETLGWDDRSAMLFGAFYTREPESNVAELKGGGQLDTSHIRRLIAKLTRKAKIDKRVHPHLLRHSRAREWSDMGVPKEHIQQALGHKSLATTSIYLARLAPAGMGAGENGRRALDTGSMMEIGG